jgi:hypothetical protein
MHIVQITSKTGKYIDGSVEAQFRLLSQQLPGDTRENYEDFSKDSRSSGRNLNLGPLEYEAGVGY